MHPDLSSHLHTPECNELIAELVFCHKNHPFGKFLGYCNVIDDRVVKCLKQERLARRQKNFEQSLEKKTRMWRLLQQEKERIDNKNQ